MSESSGIAVNVTAILQSWAGGNSTALDRAVPEIYAELKRLAEAQLRGRPANGTLSASALVNEAYVRLTQVKPVLCENRS